MFFNLYPLITRIHKRKIKISSSSVYPRLRFVTSENILLEAEEVEVVSLLCPVFQKILS